MKLRCFHCDLPVFNDKFSIVINGALRYMCCPGCMAVSKFIIDGGFNDYYLHRDAPGSKIDDQLFGDKMDFDFYNDSSIQGRFVKKDRRGLSSVVIAVDGITCAACTWLIERHIGNLPGVYKVSVNLATCRAIISFSENLLLLGDILYEFSKIGYLASPYTPKQQEVFFKMEHKRELKKLIIAAIGMLQVMMFSVALYIGETRDMHQNFWIFIRWFCFIFTCPVIFFSARSIFFNAYNSIKLKNFGMDVTISLSLIIAFCASIYNLINNIGDIYFDSVCMFVFFLLIGRFLEMRARHHSGEIIFGLQELSVDKTILLEKVNNIYVERIILVNDVKVDDIIFVKAGQIIPIDGQVAEGHSCVNEAMITGESMPVNKCKGDFVIGGTLNVDDGLVIKVINIKGNSTIDVMIHFLEKIGASKPESNLIINKVAGHFILAVLFLTVIVSFFWIINGCDNLLNVILSMLVVTCPCALSLATPVAITSSINSLAKCGFLVVKDHVLDYLNAISDIIFDKTGTLTVNNFSIDKIYLNKNKSIKDIFSIALSLEENSKHPIANAFILSKIPSYKIIYKKSDIRNFVNEGIEGDLCGAVYRLGKPDFIKGWCKKYVNLNFIDSGVWIILADKNGILAWFKLINPLRKNLKRCILGLKNIGVGIHILSGDSSDSVNNIGKFLDIDNVYKNISSKEKYEYVQNLIKSGSVVMMVGDGVNDTLALNASHVSVAMGSAVDLAKVNADSILLNNNLTNIYKSLIQGRRTKKIIKQNIFWAIFYNIFGLSFAGLNLLTPYYAAIGMSISSLLVVLNSLRLKKV